MLAHFILSIAYAHINKLEHGLNSPNDINVILIRIENNNRIIFFLFKTCDDRIIDTFNLV